MIVIIYQKLFPNCFEIKGTESTCIIYFCIEKIVFQFSGCPSNISLEYWNLSESLKLFCTIVRWLALLDFCIIYVREVRGTAGQSRALRLWKLYLQSIIYQKYLPVTWRKMPAKPAAIIYFFHGKVFCPAVPLTSHVIIYSLVKLTVVCL